MPPKENLKNKLFQAAQIKAPAERSIKIAALLAQALKKVNQDPILVGGAAVEFYTEGGYSTSDIDMIAPGGPPLFKVMEELGFERLGKDFIHSKFKIYVEFPGSRLKPEEKTNQIEIDGVLLYIISLEDLIIDRLASFKFWQSAIDGVNAMLLLESGPIDENHLLNRAQQDDVEDALKIIREIREEIIRKKLKKDDGDQLIKKSMRTLKRDQT